MPPQRPTFIHSLLEATPDGLVLVDPEGRISMVNRRLEEMLGYETGELTGAPLEVLVPEGVRARHAELRGAYERSDAPTRPMGVGLDLVARRKDGSSIPVDISLTRVHMPSGEHTLGSVRDASRQRELDRERRIHGWAIESSPGPMVFTDLDGTIVQVNRAFREQCRHPDGDDPRGLPLDAFLRAHDPPSWRETLTWTGTAEWASVPEGRSHLDVTLSTVHDESGESLCRFFSLHDTTENVLAYRALGEAEKRLRRGQTVARLGYWEWDPREASGWASDQVFEILGTELDDEPALVRRAWRRLHPDDRGMLRAAMDGACARGEPFDMECRVRTPEGETRWVRLKGEAVDETGEAPHVVGTILDITDRVRLERRLRRAQTLEAIDQLAGGVAHDFNNLLTSILGHAELILEGSTLDETAIADVHEIKSSATRASVLARQLLAFSRRQVLAPRQVDVAQAVGRAEGMLTRPPDGRITVRTGLAPGEPATYMDPLQLEQVVYNLLTNARDSISGIGEIVVTTRVEELRAGHEDLDPGMPPGTYVRLTVADTGAGMDGETLRRCFEPFFSTKGVGGGAGLGLSSAYGIVTQSGGSIRVRSRPGRGTIVHVLLPHAHGERSDAGAASGGPDVSLAG